MSDAPNARLDPQPGDLLEAGTLRRLVVAREPGHVVFTLPGLPDEGPKRIVLATWQRWARRARVVRVAAVDAVCRCSHPVKVSPATTVYPWDCERGGLNFDAPIYAHPGCLAPEVWEKRRRHGWEKVTPAS